MKKVVFLMLLAASVLQIYAQEKKPYISFKERVYDFQKVSKSANKVISHTFEFVNTGSEPLIINEVRSNCIAISNNWSKKPIPPGGKGAIRVTYKLGNKEGAFQKKIFVYSNAKNNPEVLTIKGLLVKSTQSIEEQYPVNLGAGLRAKTKYLTFGKVYKDEHKTVELEIYNNGTQDVKIDVDPRFIPAYLEVKAHPEVVKRDSIAKLSITFVGERCYDWDYIRPHFYLTANGQRLVKTPIFVSAVVKERFSEEQLKNPPIISFEETTYSFDTINQGDIVEHEFKFKNTGKSDLYIRKTHASCGCTAVSTTKGPIPPGKEGTIKAVFNSKHKAGRQVKTITVITNSPKAPKVVLKVTGYVKVPEQQQNK